MGPRNLFSENPSGTILYVNTPEGPLEVMRRASSAEVCKEKRCALFAGITGGIIATLLFLKHYLLQNADLLAGATRGWKTFYILDITAWSLVCGTMAAMLAIVCVSLFFSYKRGNFKNLRKALTKCPH